MVGRSESRGRGDECWASPDPFERYRHRLHALVTDALGGDEAASVVSKAVLAQAQAQWATRRPARPPGDLVVWRWLRSLAVEGCAWAAEEGVEAVAGALRRMEAEAGPLTRAMARDRARWRRAFEARMRDLGALGAIPWRWARQQWRRFEEATTSMAPATPRMGVLGSAAGLSPAALAATATLALGAVIPQGPEPPTRVTPLEVAADVERVRAVTSEPPLLPAAQALAPLAPPNPSLTVSPATTPRPAPAVEASGETEPRAPAPASAPPLTLAPRLTGDPSESLDQPISEKPTSSGTAYGASGEGVGVDVDSDGEDEAWTTTPPVFVHCANDPERNGPVTGAMCPVLEESGYPGEPWNG